VLSKKVSYAVKINVAAELAQKAMSRTEPQRVADSPAKSKIEQRTIDKALRWLEHYDDTKVAICLIAPPFMIFHLMNRLEEEGRCFAFGERAGVFTAGGWKTRENKRISLKAFRTQVHDVLGIPETRCIDAYSMSEGNALMVSCPEGHYLHVPHTYFKPLILGEDLQPVGYGQPGRFAFLDAIARSYPGFVITGDQALMLEHCPVCDRPGPVLEPEVQRVTGEEVRGCAEQVRRTIAETLVPDLTETA
jgi:hypothetical protein